MPIRPEFRKFYRSAEWREIRERIRTRDKNRCARCGKPHDTWCLVVRDGTGRYSLAAHRTPHIPKRTRWEIGAARALRKIGFTDWVWHAPGAAPPKTTTPPTKGKCFAILIVCCVAHLDHNPQNNADDNLELLCQHCHLRHDARQHYANRRRSQAAEAGQQWLNPEMAEHI